MGSGDVGLQVALRHALAEGSKRRAERLDRDVAGLLHQRQLGRALDHAAAGGDDFAINEVGTGAFLLHAAEDEEAQPFFHGHPAGGGTAVLQDAGDLAIGAFVFLPDANLGVLGDQLAGPFFFKSGTHPCRLALGGDHAYERPLAVTPADAGVIEHARATLEEQRADLAIGHQLLGALNAGGALAGRDRLHVSRHRLERGDGGMWTSRRRRDRCLSGSGSGVAAGEAGAKASGGAGLQEYSTRAVHCGSLLGGTEVPPFWRPFGQRGLMKVPFCSSA
jgi:hypothetical protein